MYTWQTIETLGAAFAANVVSVDTLRKSCLNKVTEIVWYFQY